MNEDFVSFELAVKLKERGLNIPFYFFYRSDDKLIHHAMVAKPLVYCDNIDDEVVCAPTIPQVLKWLREAKNVFIEISITTSGYYSTVYSNIDLTLANKTTYYQEYVGATNEDYNNCVLEAIEYILDNLI